MNLIDALEAAANQLAPIHDTGQLDAEVLLAFVLDKPRHLAYAFPERKLSLAQADAYATLVARRTAGEPVAYITGEREFWSMSLRVTPDTLIPRPDTERLVEIALNLMPPDQRCRIADLGTGTGAIALALAIERVRCLVVATDNSESALEVARDNATRHQLSNIEFRLGNWCDALNDELFELIVCNPPYVKVGDSHLSQGDVRFEPSTALIGGPDGLDEIRCVCDGARSHLHPGGYLLVEHGAEQKHAAHDLMVASGYQDIVHYQDYAQRDRVTQARLPA